MGKIVLGLLMLFSNVAGACETKMKVFYIDLGKKFFVPPVPIEKYAEKKLVMKDCKLEELFKAAVTADPIGDGDMNRARIKIVDGKGKKARTLYIDDAKQVVWANHVVKVAENQIEEVISLIKAK